MLILALVSLALILHMSRSIKETVDEHSEETAEELEQEEAEREAQKAEEEAAMQEIEDAAIASHVYSHRGSAGAEEHSFKAYDAAIEAGSRYIEQDVVISSDGILYVSHDENAVYMTGYDGMYEYMSSETIDSLETDNPYGVPIGLGNWAGSGSVVNFGSTICMASSYFPDIISKDEAFKATSFLFGCHPYHNYSYGNNRADLSFIPGNVAPGLLFRKPDHFENYDDWPFLWGQNEGTIGGNVSYLTFGLAFKNLMGR